jgi:hypothetical protein
MLKIFRKIRQKLLKDLPAGQAGNKIGSPALPAGRYLKYAIGEILLVVIGILIALSINNWNENLKENKLGLQYLEGIENDLKEDLVQLRNILDEQLIAVRIIHSIDNIFVEEYHEPEKYQYFFSQVDTTKMKHLFYRGYSFRPSNSTFNSLISDGKSGLISNSTLFHYLQEIYTEISQRNNSNYQSIREIEQEIRWNYPNEKKYWTYSDLKKAKNEKIFLDLADFAEEKYFYALSLSRLEEKITTTLKILDKEISNK